ncbi:class C sortase [Bifidobacteriaceae bacterium NR044]|nr:class C sortase [Bifidobacteriaceae bacterium NR043]MBF9353710.1 class C sortase [Bifidobacteriaceae bacterium NR044]RFT39704.1 class C sortase [Bifidobacteriaceae bacterium NR003]
MKLNSAVTKVYAFLNKISQNKLFKNQTNATQANETNLAASPATESDATQIIPTQIALNQTNETNLTATETNPTASPTTNSPESPAQKPHAAHKSQQKSMLRRIIEPIAFVLAGLLCFAYPVCSTLWNNRVSKEISSEYDKYNHDQAGDVRRAHLRAARRYNARHKAIITSDPYDGTTDYMNKPEYKEYAKQLDEPMGIMGIVKIPKIGVKLPIYHGSSQEVLAHGAGHLYGTDLPVGGKNRHAVVTAHTGLPDATMFDDLVNLKKGDYFYFDVQGETLRYKVFRISVVDPHDISLLQREKGRDLATLLTCTPYGVNSHRLLVTGYRVLPDPVKAPEDRVQWPLWMTLFVLAMILTFAVLATMVATLWRKKRDEIYVRGRHLLAVSRSVLSKLRRG